MNEQQKEVESFQAKIDLLKGLVSAIQERNRKSKRIKLSVDEKTEELRKSRNSKKITDEAIENRNTALAKNAAIPQTSYGENEKSAKMSNLDCFQSMSESLLNDKILSDSSDRLSQLARRTWTSKRQYDWSHNGIFLGKQYRTSLKSLGKMDKSAVPGSAKAQISASKTKRQRDIHSNASRSMVYMKNKEQNRSEKAMKHVRKETENTSSLNASSERLSSLAKDVWKRSAAPESLNSGFEKQKDESFTWKKFFVDGAHGKCQKSVEKDEMNHPKLCKNCTNSRLSSLAREVWSKKKLHRNFQRAYALNGEGKRQKWRQWNLKPGVTNKRYIGVLKPSNYTWTSGRLNSNSFMRRRAIVIIKQNRFSIVKAIPQANASKIPLVQYQMSTKMNWPQIRTHSFIYRRKANIYKRRADKFNDITPNSSKQTAIRKIQSERAQRDMQILFNANGRRFQTDVHGRRLRRISSTSRSSTTTGFFPGNLSGPHSSQMKNNGASKYRFLRRQSSDPSSVSKLIANRVIRRSVFHLNRQKQRKVLKKQYCMFFNRFGKCKNGAACKYLHDPDKVAVCTRFLRGTCREESCLFSHKIDKKKMPTCSFFLRGRCHKDDCPYAHVKVSFNADICQEFVKGHCPNGEKCLRRHVLECSDFQKTGKCPNGEKCKLYHHKRLGRKRKSISGIKTPRPFCKKRKTANFEEDGTRPTGTIHVDLPIKPAFITSSSPEKSSTGVSRGKRRRRFDWKKANED